MVAQFGVRANRGAAFRVSPSPQKRIYMQDGKSARPWRTIAQELSKETDRGRVSELSKELIRALSEQVGYAKIPGEQSVRDSLPKKSRKG
jgi:hypothetical protein